jgi:MFS transporter, PAT family, beta-lactamase induction signal transducer AmpG
VPLRATIPPLRRLIDIFTNRRMAAQLFLGFASGVPLALTGDTLVAWMRDRQVDLAAIGLFSLVGFPYLLKFVWSPLMDRYVPPILGRRRGWILVVQVLLMVAIAAMALGNPSSSLLYVALLALMVAFLSASQDIVIDAYRTDVLPAEERGAGVAVSSTGYRVAMVTSGAGALILADWGLPWGGIYLLMAGAMGLGVLATLFAPEPERVVAPPQTLAEAVINPFFQFIKRPGGWLTLLFVAVFRLPDVTAGMMTLPFLMDVGFSKQSIGILRQFMGPAVVTAGALAGGIVVARLSLLQCLWIFAFVQALSNVSFLVLAQTGPRYDVLVGVVVVESFCTGLTLAGFLAFLISQCDPRYSATQYALLSSVMALARVFGGAPTGYVVEGVGWSWFFLITIAAGVPGVLLLPWLNQFDYNKDRPLDPAAPPAIAAAPAAPTTVGPTAITATDAAGAASTTGPPAG